MESPLSLYELNEFIRQAIELNFEESIWLQCEIAQIGESRGHRYLTLIEKAQYHDEIIAQSQAVLWRGTFEKIRSKYRESLMEVLQDGAQVNIRVKIDFHERYGLKLIIEDLDVSYTLGQVALQRQQTIEKLAKNELLTKNEALSLENVIQRVAIISSETAAGYQDFINQVVHNPYGYQFNLHLFPAAVQGKNLVPEFLVQLERIYHRADDFDLIAIIRGGGGKMDLGYFDNYDLCEFLANSPLPVVTGIGHDIDETVADLVSHTSLKTPTAVAEFIINHNASFEGEIQHLIQLIQRHARWQVQSHRERLFHISRDINQAAKTMIQEEYYNLEGLQYNMNLISRNLLNKHHEALENFARLSKALDPENVLKRGYAIVYKDQKIVSHSKKIKKEDQLDIQLDDGIIKTKVIE